MRGVLCALLVAAGCDRVLGFDEVKPSAPDAPAADAAVVTHVTVTRTLRYIFSDAQGVPTSQTVPFPPGELTVTAELRDGTPIAVTSSDPIAATFTFDVPIGSTYIVRFTSSVGTAAFETSVANLVTPDLRFGRPDAHAAAPGTILEFDNVPALGSNAIAVNITSTGEWSERAAMATATTGQWVESWSTGPPLLDGTKGDRAYLVEYDRVAPNINAVTRVASVAPQMQPGMTTKLNLAGQWTAVTPSSCLHVDPMNTSRLTLADFPNNAGLVFEIGATPLPEYGIGVALGLIGGTSDGNPYDAHFANPYAGLTTFAQYYGYGFRTVTGTSLTQEGVISILTPTTADATCKDTPLATTVEIPGNIKLDGVLLTADHTTVGIPPAMNRFAVTWDDVTPGTADAYYVTVFEATATTYLPRESIATTDRQVTLDPALFEAGKEYMVQVQAITGTPNARSGDWIMRAGSQEATVIPSRQFAISH